MLNMALPFLANGKELHQRNIFGTEEYTVPF